MKVVEMDGPGGEWLVVVPETRRERIRGLRGRPPPGIREAMLLPRCRSVHTFGLKGSIDVVFLDRELTVTQVQRCRPRRVLIAWRRGRHVLETGAGSEVRIGDRFSPAAGSAR